MTSQIFWPWYSENCGRQTQGSNRSADIMSHYADHFEKRECNKDITRVRRIIEKIVFLRGPGRKFCANIVTYKYW